MSGTEGLPMLSWLAIPVVTLAARFSNRGIVVGALVAVVLLLAVGFGVDHHAVLANPVLVIAPLSLISA